MNRLLTTTAAAIALSAGVAQAECEASLAEMREAHTEGLLARGTGDVRNVVRDLQNAAMRFNALGDEAGCEAVVDAIDQVASRTAAAEGTATEVTTAAERGDPKARVVSLKEAGVTFNTSSLKGVNVYNYKDEFLGEVDGLLVQAGQTPSHVIIGHGGFWNIGDEEAAIPLDKLKWDPEWEVFYINMTEEQLDQAPDYDVKNGEWRIDENDSYYGKLAE